jgi:succinate dehydrogenase hydrophobic anchor subunit
MRLAQLKYVFLAAAAMTAPSFAFAQDIQRVFVLFSSMLNALIGMLITVAIIVFFWGLIRYLLHDGSSEDAHKGIHQMIWGVVAIFVMVSIWGLIALLQRTFGVENARVQTPGTIPLQWKP